MNSPTTATKESPMNHSLTVNLTTWTCSCGNHGVIFTVTERRNMTICPSDTAKAA